MQSLTHSCRHRTAFTLLEVLMALFLGGMLLTAAAAFLFGLFNLTVETEEAPVGKTHADAVADFLAYAFSTALPPSQDDAAANQSAVAWQPLPGSIQLNEQALALRLPGDLPLFFDDSLFLPELNCFLVFDRDDGLVFLWQTDAMATEDTGDFRRTIVSPLAVSMEYLYYDVDSNQWDSVTEPEQDDGGGFRLPDFLRLEFELGRQEAVTRYVLLPSTTAGGLVP